MSIVNSPSLIADILLQRPGRKTATLGGQFDAVLKAAGIDKMGDPRSLRHADIELVALGYNHKEIKLLHTHLLSAIAEAEKEFNSLALNAAAEAANAEGKTPPAMSLGFTVVADAARFMGYEITLQQDGKPAAIDAHKLETLVYKHLVESLRLMPNKSLIVRPAQTFAVD